MQTSISISLLIFNDPSLFIQSIQACYLTEDANDLVYGNHSWSLPIFARDLHVPIFLISTYMCTYIPGRSLHYVAADWTPTGPEEHVLNHGLIQVSGKASPGRLLSNQVFIFIAILGGQHKNLTYKLKSRSNWCSNCFTSSSRIRVVPYASVV